MNETSGFSLDWLISPLTMTAFQSDFWQKKPVHLIRNDHQYFSRLFTIEAFESTLVKSGIKTRDLRVFDHGDRLPSEQYLDSAGRPKMTSIWQLFAEGKTINYYNPHHDNENIARLCRDLETRFHHQTCPALFLTPAGTTGLNPHYDHLDIFVLQLWGKKTWRLYEPVFDSPFRNEDQLPVDAAKLGKPVLDAELQSGEVLYLPRGYIHEPFTTDEPSLHLSLGITFFVWYDLLKEILESAVSGDALLRQPIPSELLKNPDLTAFDEAISQALAVLQTHAKAGPAVRKLVERVYLDQHQPSDGHFQHLARLADIGPNTRLIKRDVAIGFVAENGEKAELVFSGNKLTGPRHLAPVLRDIAARTEPFRPVDLVCSLSEKSRLVLIRKLVKQGYLKIAETS